MKFALEDARDLPIDGSAWITFLPRVDEVWAITGRNEKHPGKVVLEIVRYNTTGTPAAESQLTPAQFGKVAAWGKEADAKEVEPVESEPVMPKRVVNDMPSTKKTSTRMPRSHK